MAKQVCADGSYPYLCPTKGETIGYRLLSRLILAVFPPIFRLFFGLRVEGWENFDALGGEGAVTVCNHIHPLDCVILACSCRCRKMAYLSLKSNLEMPVVGKLIRVLNAVPVPQTVSGFSALRSAIKDWVGAGNLFQVYPEGWLIPWCDTLRPFKKGSFSFAYDANVPVLPYVLCQTPHTGIAQLWHSKPALTLRILPAIVPNVAQPRRQEIARVENAVRAAMEQALHESGCVHRAMHPGEEPLPDDALQAELPA